MHIGYIYEIRNDINGKTYVGKHGCSEGNDRYMGSGVLLKPAYKKYGIEHFTKKIIQYSPTLEDLNRSEELWIDFYKGIGKAEYNIAAGGKGGNPRKYMTDEQIAEWRRHCSEAHKDKPSPNKGKKGHPAWNKDKKLSEEHCRKLSEAHKCQPAWNKGLAWSDEAKKHMSEAHKDKRPSEETRRKMSAAHKDKHHDYKGKHWKLVDGKRVWY